MLHRYKVLVTALIMSAGCASSFDDPVGTPLLGAVPADRPECPHDGLLSRKENGGGVFISPNSPEAIVTSIPEYHDCQRFVVDRGGSLVYDSVYAIYAAPPKHSKGSKDYQSRTDGDGNRAAAIIVSEGGTYAPLGIRPGVNCLYLEPAGTTWKPFIVHNGMNANCPVNPYNLKSFSNFDVVADPLPAGLTPDDVPEVARWDWDAKNNVQYIGIRCGDQWCEIGPPGFITSPALPVPAGVNGTDTRVYLIKGWYDRQLLAEPGTDPAVPSKTIGVIVPHYKLPSLAESMQLQPVGPQLMASYMEAVRIYLDDNITLVKSVWVTNAAGAGGTYDWGAVVETPGVGKTESPVIYRTHVGLNFTIPATARWRWNPASDGHSAALEHESDVALSDLQQDAGPGPIDHETGADIFSSVNSARAWLADFMTEGVWFGCAVGCCEEEELEVLAANDDAPAMLFWGGYRAFAGRTSPLSEWSLQNVARGLHATRETTSIRM
jgi:hypothetical protein